MKRRDFPEVAGDGAGHTATAGTATAATPQSGAGGKLQDDEPARASAPNEQ